jgi:hypothetical protein
MRQALLFLSLGLLGGFAVSAWWPTATTDEISVGDRQVGDLDRVARLERQLTQQVGALRRELEALRAEVTQRGTAEVTAGSARSPEEGSVLEERSADDTVLGPDLEVGNAPVAPRERRFRMRSSEGRVEAMTEAGFSVDRAQHIERRIEELRVEAMQARYDAARRGESDAPVEDLFDANAMLREELGEADYERYLTAMGRPTRVDVLSVLSSSAAEQAGMQPGDQIVAYAGQRVYDVRELNQALLGGEPGESVLVEIVRDGQPLQLMLPRGPLGISGGFSRRIRGQ